VTWIARLPPIARDHFSPLLPESLHTLAGSGCRITEVVTLTAGQITMREGGWFLQVMGKRQKGRREAPLSQEAWACVQTWLAQRADAGVLPTAPLDALWGGREAAHRAAVVDCVALAGSAQVCPAVRAAAH
jgi:site-specific recombinase XerC